jgi:ABC-2 type transport system ATP-binding protein
LFVETHALTKRYGSVTALEGCTLGVERGEVFGLLGPNGSGKTTLLRLLLGFLQPTSGGARIDTLDCFQQSLEIRSRISYLPAEARMFRRMRGRDVLKFFSQLRGDGSLRRSEQIADRLGLEAARPVVQMSTGMRQKLALSVALAPVVPLVILDEPTSSLDPTVRSEVISLVRQIKHEGRTVLFSSHVLSEVERVCDRVAIVRHGRLVHTQVVSELGRQHRITALLNGKMPALPDEFQKSVRVRVSGENSVSIEADEDLPPLLGWLATLPASEMRIEPVGLETVYERYYQAGSR